MEQRPLRLGDIVDDYCPRERRITNHAIVAIVGVDIKQTRCSTCEAEHVYKEARMPRRKKPEPTAYEQVLSDVTAGQRVAPPRQEDVEPPAPDAAEPAPVAAKPAAPPVAIAAAPTRPPAAIAARPAAPAAVQPPIAAAPPEDTSAGNADLETPHDAWLSHRRLIRASLPKVEGELPPARPIPEFTMHQPPPRPMGRGRFGQPWHGGGERHHRGGNPNANGNGSGNAHGNGFRHGHGRPVEGNGQPGQPGPVGDGQPRKSGRRRRRRRPRSQP